MMEAPEDRDEARVCEAILAVVRARCGIDFRDQRPEVILRGITRRMSALGLVTSGACATADYLARLERDGDEVARLAEALVVPVSAFFRDPQVWRCLETVVLPEQSALDPGGGLRVWAAGIATGEEAWTVAMLLLRLREARPTTRVELLATDVDERSLAIAREGRYPAAALAAVPASFQGFLQSTGTDVVVASELKALLTFARHDLMGPTLAPPAAIIATFALVVARNVLLYFDQRLRTKALERLHGVLRCGGALVLGSVETMPEALATKFRPYPGLPESLHVFRREG
jgi:two-component system CheB/CheR fusion protein